MKYQKSSKALRRIRQNIFNYPDHMEEKADNVLRYLKTRSLRDCNNDLPVGPYSGLTRAELRQTGTCETDWY